MKPEPAPRVLLVEDDPVSAAFLGDALAALPAGVDVAGSLLEALSLAADGAAHALYLVDANLPDGRGEVLLQGLRTRGLESPALAHTATDDPRVRARLLAAGFVDVFQKPIGIEELHAVVRPHLSAAARAARDGCGRRTWDDRAALQVLGGHAGHVASLRALFLQELPGQRDRLQACARAGDAAGVRAELHRLSASCDLVGATRLREAVRGLQASPLDHPALARLGKAVDELLD